MKTQTTIRYVGVIPGKTLGKRQINNITKAGLHAAGTFWHRVLRLKHFTNRGAREYGYAPRKGESGNPDPTGFKRSYTGRKLKKFGHTRPLEYTGKSRSLTEIRDVQAVKNRARVTLRSPGYNRRNKYSQINMRDELVAVSTDDVVLLTRVIRKGITAGLRGVRKTKTVAK